MKRLIATVLGTEDNQHWIKICVRDDRIAWLAERYISQVIDSISPACGKD